ncbi:MAG: glycosyltransferase family 2 protein [Chloroflexi bacterium]|nr:glycosyltransferase family 2 protein [Chloroflexota bacterium]
MNNNKQLDFSVVICTYTEARWQDLTEAVESVRQQNLPPLEIIVVVDGNPALYEKIRREIPDVICVENFGAKGASGSRNSGAAAAKAQAIAFLDDDAVAEPDWLAQLSKGLCISSAAGVGGRINPLWQSKRPVWFPNEFDWVVGGTYRGMPETLAPIRNAWTGNLAVRKQIFEAVGGFRSGFGKIGARSQPEDTDFCIRVTQRFPDKKWFYIPEAVVWHKTPASRATFLYFLTRTYNEGWGKASLATLVGSRDGLSEEFRYTGKVLTRALYRNFIQAFQSRNTAGFRQNGAILSGLFAAGFGYFHGLADRFIFQRKKQVG